MAFRSLLEKLPLVCHIFAPILLRMERTEIMHYLRNKISEIDKTLTFVYNRKSDLIVVTLYSHISSL